MEVVRLCLVVAETRRLRPVRPPCGRPLYSSCGIIRARCLVSPYGPAAPAMRPRARLHGGKHFRDRPFRTAILFSMFCLVETHLVGGTEGIRFPCRLSGGCRVVS